jgi:lysophospholipid acyltransferase (LPLAT)-like uncharacterized protein
MARTDTAAEVRGAGDPAARPVSAGWRLLARAVAVLLRVLGATWRVRIEGEDPFTGPRPVIGVAWHQGLLAAAWCWRDRGFTIPVSRSRDGSRIDAVLRRMGFAESARGSSSRGATALLRSLIRVVRRGGHVGFLPDGPRGPARTAKPGVVALARATGAPLVPVGIAARPRKVFGSWDAAFLPLPFARVRCRYGPPLVVPKKADAEELEAWRRRLEAELERLQGEVEAELGLPHAPREATPCGS